MKKGFLLLFTFAAALSCSTVHADPVDYSDGIVSFQYDDAYNGSIMRSYIDYNDSVSATYYIDSQMKSDETDTDYNSAQIYIGDFGESWAQDNFLNESLKADTIEKNTVTSFELPYERTLDMTDGTTCYQKYFGNYDNLGVVLSLTTNNENSDHYTFCKTIFDSVEIADQFFESGFENIEDVPFIVYNNGIYSSKIQPYLEQTVNICDAFLQFKIDDTEAWRRISAIKDVIETDFSDSDYICDQNVSLLFPNEMDFTLGDDGEIIRCKEYLLNAIDSVDKD